MLTLVVPCIGLYILKYRCIEAWSTPTASTWPNTASPILCLTPGTYGIPVPRHKPDARVCQQRFNELCTLVISIFFLHRSIYSRRNSRRNILHDI